MCALAMLLGGCGLASAQQCPASGCTGANLNASPAIDSAHLADSYPGGDTGEKINNAVAACVAAGIVCTIQVNKSGTISTPPVLPAGFSLVFNPTGVYTLDANWVLNHRGVSVYFNGAHFTYAKADSGVAIYVGKGISSTVQFGPSSASSASCNTSTLSWVAGSQFSTIDPGDTISFSYQGKIYAANVHKVSATSLGLLQSLNLPCNTTFPMIALMVPGNGLGAYSGASVTLRDLAINDSSRTAKDTALELELVSNVRVDNFSAYDFVSGTCAKLLGALVNNFSALQCDVDGNGLMLGNNVLGGFTFTGSNANRFYGIDLNASPLAPGIALQDIAGSDNLFSGLHVEGNANDKVIDEAGGQNHYEFLDYERNGTGKGYEITVGSSYNTLEGPAQMHTYHGLLAAIVGGVGNVVQNLQFNAQAPGATAVACQASCNFEFRNNAVLAGSVLGLSRSGTADLQSGTVAVITGAACAPSATCVYRLSNCGTNASSAIGTLAVGSVMPGASFVINSLTPAAAIAAGDASTVCWQIN